MPGLDKLFRLHHARGWPGRGCAIDDRRIRRVNLRGEPLGSTALWHDGLLPDHENRDSRGITSDRLEAQTIFASFFLSVLGLRRR